MYSLAFCLVNIGAHFGQEGQLGGSDEGRWMNIYNRATIVMLKLSLPIILYHECISVHLILFKYTYCKGAERRGGHSQQRRTVIHNATYCYHTTKAVIMIP
jgi:hypothetical protein